MHKIWWYNVVKQGVFHTGRWELRATSGKISKNLVEIAQSKLLAVFGRFCMWVLWRGFVWKMRIFGPWFGTLDWLCAFWTAGITAHPLDMGSSCTTIFQVSNRTIRCILNRSGGCWDPGMYSYFPMKCKQRVGYFALIRQVSWRATCIVSDQKILTKI